MKNKIYIVSYSVDYIDRIERPIFATESKGKARLYCVRFNIRLQYWKEYYDELFQLTTIDEQLEHPLYDRWRQLEEINNSFITEIELR